MEDDFMLILSEQNQMHAIQKTNVYAKSYGLSLTDSNIKELLSQRRECLAEQQRVEFGAGILDKLILAFCDSDYIYQDIYAETIVRIRSVWICSLRELIEYGNTSMVFGRSNAIYANLQGAILSMHCVLFTLIMNRSFSIYGRL